MAKTQTQSVSGHQNVYAALAAAREEFLPVIRNEEADVGKFRYKYADLAQVLEATVPALTAHGLVPVQRTAYRDGVCLLVTEIMHVDSGTSVVCEYPLLPARANDPQALGGAMTYARRYSYFALLNLAPEDDDGRQASKPAVRKPLPKSDTTPADESDVMAMIRYLDEATNIGDLKQRYVKCYESNQAVAESERVVNAKNALKKILAARE